ncbi:flagellar hook-associated protein 2 [Anaerobacterium chartisolvens]|uniref:Flagellar hook-associated protein 2 n=2 Tax=Anaerobacterium chartisolvens TaxID=1297424 RepID=A0A369B521_9FIRM|nr:flagellar hook-associated protein 2 [Anaerobacterium chartisolvens]
MAINGINPYNTTMRVMGLSGSGLDTQSIVTQLMQAERMPYNSIYRKKELIEWKTEAYRSVTNVLKNFQSKYLADSYGSFKSTSMLSQLQYKKFTTTAIDSVTKAASSIVSVSGDSTSIEGTHTIQVINMAKAQIIESDFAGGGASSALAGSDAADFSELAGKSFRISVDGVNKLITFNSSHTFTSADDLVNNAQYGLNKLLEDAFGAGKVLASEDGGKITFGTGAGVSRLSLYMGAAESEALSALKFSAGDSNRLSLGTSLEQLAEKGAFKNSITFGGDDSDTLEFEINGKKFSFNKSVTLSSMLSTINGDSTARVNIQYDSTADKFIMTAKQLGDGKNIVIKETKGNFFSGTAAMIDITDAEGNSTNKKEVQQGTDANVVIDGQTLKRSSNVITVNGVTYTLTGEGGNVQNVSLVPDTESVFNSIKGFVEEYNSIIDTINSKLSEKYDRNYQPLTSEEKEAMTEEQIKKWEEKAKTGLLKNDSILQSMVYQMRAALYSSVEGVSASLSNVGITTGDYSQKGKLTIDEKKLREALQNNPDAVMNLFSKKSDTSYDPNMTKEQKAERNSQQGLMWKLSDIINDNIRTSRNSNNEKGFLLEKAGLVGDASEYSNMLYDQIEDYNDKLKDLANKLGVKEEKYYLKFANLEKLLAKMNSQSNWFSQQFGKM